MNIRKDMTVGEVVLRIPRAVDVFHSLKIDYCCGGDRSMETALTEAGLDFQAVVAQLEDIQKTATIDETLVDAEQMDIPKLIDYIEHRHHVYAKAALKRIDDFMFKVLKAHYTAHSTMLLELHKTVGLLRLELQAHLIEEEEELFPALLEQVEAGGDFTNVQWLVERMVDEHDGAGDLLKKIEELTQDFTPPQGACPTFELLYKELHGLQLDVFRHVFLENTVLVGKIKGEKA